MASDKHRALATRLLALPPSGPRDGTAPGEELLGATRAWVARVGPQGHVFFVGRHRALVAITDRRLVAWRHPKPGAAATIDVPLAALRLRGEHSARPFFQVLASVDPGSARGTGRETVVLEFRHRDHAIARAVGRAIAGTATPAAASASAPTEG